MKRLTLDFFRQDGLTLARDLLGKIFIFTVGNQKIKTKIVETEAYMAPRDKASHAYNNRKTSRTKTMFLDGGHLYVYQIYGMYFCLNITANHKEVAEAVLIRALEPLDNMDILKQNRKIKIEKESQLTNGPGKLCQALNIDKRLNGLDITKSSEFYLEENPDQPFDIVETKRIGIDYAEEFKDKKWRFYIKENRYISKK